MLSLDLGVKIRIANSSREGITAWNLHSVRDTGLHIMGLWSSNSILKIFRIQTTKNCLLFCTTHLLYIAKDAEHATNGENLDWFSLFLKHYSNYILGLLPVPGRDSRKIKPLNFCLEKDMESYQKDGKNRRKEWLDNIFHRQNIEQICVRPVN